MISFNEGLSKGQISCNIVKEYFKNKLGIEIIRSDLKNKYYDYTCEFNGGMKLEIKTIFPDGKHIAIEDWSILFHNKNNVDISDQYLNTNNDNIGIKKGWMHYWLERQDIYYLFVNQSNKNIYYIPLEKYIEAFKYIKTNGIKTINKATKGYNDNYYTSSYLKVSIQDMIQNNLLKILDLNIFGLFNIDCRLFLDIIPNNIVDLIITDYPYGIDFNSNRRVNKGSILTESGIHNDNIDNEQFLLEVCTKMYNKLKDGCHAYFFDSPKTLIKNKKILEKAGFNVHQILILNKKNHGMGDLYGSYAPKYEICFFCYKGHKRNKFYKYKDKIRHPDVLDFEKIPKERLLHHHQKPIDILKLFIGKSSQENNIVLDPFCGSGSTIIACKEMNRKYICCEIDKKIYEIAKNRKK